MLQPLNWREIHRLAEQLSRSVSGQLIKDVYVPKREKFRNGFLLHEICVETKGNPKAIVLFSLRSSSPYICFTLENKLERSRTASESPFILSLRKALKDSRILGIDALENERILRFSIRTESERDLELVLIFFSAAARAYVRDKLTGQIIVESKPGAGDPIGLFDSRGVKREYSIRNELNNVEQFYSFVQNALLEEERNSAKSANARAKEAELKKIRAQLESSRESLRRVEREISWKDLGENIKLAMNVRPDRWSEGVGLPSSIKDLGAKEAMTFCFQRHKEIAAKKIKIIERLALLESKFSNLTKAAAESQETLNAEQSEVTKTVHPRGWKGKVFYSSEGTAILVGTNLKENLELSFKHANGNDIWMHVKGRPSAHVVVALEAGKSPSLETLLDAASLLLYYSSGKDWGKTEIDYVPKKFVSKIKGTAKVRYSQNKSLAVECDGERLNRLLKRQNV